ncbi:MAG: AraC family transcriptional regulator [Luteolibacter sp.]
MSASAKSSNHYQQCIQKAQGILEVAKDEIPTLEELAKAAGLSPFHFHRIFRSIVGEPVARYHKRIRLERTASRLSHSSEPITEISLGAGFESSSAFSKAFRSHFGCSPSTFRKRGPGISNTIFENNRQQTTMNMKVEIKKIDPIEVYAVRTVGSYKEAAAEAFGKLMPFAYGNKLMRPETRVFGIGHDNPGITDSEKIRYDACFTRDVSFQPSGEVRNQTIKGGLYAIALHKGSYETLVESYDALIGTWLSENKRELRGEPLFEEYLNRDPRRTKPENLRTLIYIPIK